MYLIGTICSKNSFVEIPGKEKDNRCCKLTRMALLVDTFISLSFAATGVMTILALKQYNLGPLNAMLTLGQRDAEMLMGFAVFTMVTDTILFCTHRRVERILKEMESAKKQDPKLTVDVSTQQEIETLKRRNQEQTDQYQKEMTKLQAENDTLNKRQEDVIRLQRTQIQKLSRENEDLIKEVKDWRVKQELLEIEIDMVVKSMENIKGSEGTAPPMPVVTNGFDPNEEY